MRIHVRIAGRVNFCCPRDRSQYSYITRVHDPSAIIDFSCDSGSCTLETYYSNFIARQLYVQKWLKYRKISYWIPVTVWRRTGISRGQIIQYNSMPAVFKLGAK